MKRISAVLLFLCSTVVPSPAIAETAPGDELTAIRAQLAELNTSLQKIADLMHEITVRQQIDLLLKRAELKERRLSPFQELLAGAMTRSESLEQEIADLTNQRDAMQASRDDVLQSGSEEDAASLREGIRYIESRLDLLHQQLENSFHRTRELELDLVERREDLDDLNDLLESLFEKLED